MRGPGTNYFTLPMGLLLFALAAALLKKSPPVRRTGTAVLLAFAGFARLDAVPHRWNDRRLSVCAPLAMEANGRRNDARRP